MTVTVTNTTRQRVAVAVIRKAVEATLRHFKKRGDVSVVIVGHARMRQVNRVYRGKDRVTDILSFTESEGLIATPGFLGELLVDYLVIKQQAKKFSPSLQKELAFIVIHGTLHLLGYEDETDTGAATMDRLGHLIMKKLF